MGSKRVLSWENIANKQNRFLLTRRVRRVEFKFQFFFKLISILFLLFFILSYDVVGVVAMRRKGDYVKYG